MLRISVVILSVVFIAACTQPPARVDMRGQQTFSRGSQPNYNSSSSYNSNSSYSSDYKDTSSSYSAPVSQATESKASVSSIGISDLAPPSETKPTPQIETNDEEFSAPVKTEKKSYGSKPALKTTVNPWTNKPRGSNEKNEIKEVIKTAQKESPKEEKKIVLKTKSSSELKWPTASNKIISSFGSKGAGRANDGVNIAADDGSPVWAAADGQVVYVKNNVKGYGNMVLVKHSGDRITSYAHLSSIKVNKYEKIAQGEIIGYVGTTGSAKRPQLFFSLHKGREAVNPQKYVSTQLAGL